MRIAGTNLKRGIEVPSLKREKKWTIHALKAPGDQVAAGDILGMVQETELVQQKILVPPGTAGTLQTIQSGQYTVTDTIAILRTEDAELPLYLMQKWPVRVGRPYVKKLPPDMPLITGQRVIDTLFPIAKGGVVQYLGHLAAGKRSYSTSLPSGLRRILLSISDAESAAMK